MYNLQNLQTTIDQQVPLSQVRLRYNEVVQKAKSKGYVLVLKNYVPHSVIATTDFFLKHLNGANQVSINDEEKKRRFLAVKHLLEFREQIFPKVKKFDPLKQLSKDRMSH